MGQESEQNTGLPSLKENMMARFLADHPQAEDSVIKVLSGIEVIDIDRCFDNGFDLHDCLQLAVISALAAPFSATASPTASIRELPET